MTARRLLTLAAAALLGTACSRRAPSPPPASVPLVVVEGRVAWADRTPAEEVLVEGFREANDVPCRTTSGHGGAFRLTCTGVDWVRVVAIPEMPGGGRVELIPDFKRYEARAEPYKGVELFANRPKPRD